METDAVLGLVRNFDKYRSYIDNNRIIVPFGGDRAATSSSFITREIDLTASFRPSAAMRLRDACPLVFGRARIEITTVREYEVASSRALLETPCGVTLMAHFDFRLIHAARSMWRLNSTPQ